MGFLIDITFDALAWVIAGLGAIIHSLVSVFFWLASMLLELAFSLEKFTTAGVVKMGWGLTRDLVNLFFVLVLLVIAFATILRIESYGAKQLLRNLIIIALLINFSLVICGAIIDSSQIVTHFFYDEVRGANGVGARIASALKIQKVSEINPEASAPEKIAAGLGGVFMMIFSILMGIILILAAALAVGIGAFFLISRIIALWILIILAPIGWFCSILPGTKQYAKQWWNSFLKWVIFAPVYAFFVWLAVKIGEAGAFTGIIDQEMENIVATQGGWKTAFSALLSAPSLVLQFFVILGFLYAGLIVAQKTGAYGADGAVKMAKMAGVGAVGLTGKLGQRAVLRLAPPPQKTPEGKEKGGLVQRGLRQFAKVPFAGKLAAPAFRGLEKIRTAVDKEKEKIKGWTSDNLAATFDRANTEGKISRMLQLYENDDLDKLNPKQQEQGLRLAQRYGKTSNLIKALPGFTEKLNIGKKLQDIVNSLSPDKMTKLVPDQVKTEGVSGEQLEMAQEVQKAIINAMQKGFITSAHLGKIGSENQPLARVVQKEIMGKKEVVDGFPTALKDYLKSAPGKSIYSVAEEWLGATKKESVISSPTESEFQKAKEQGYKGK